MNIITDKIVFGGNSIGKVDGKMVFIPYAIPSEELEIEIVDSKKDYDVAKIKTIIKKSPYRVEPDCEYYENCGGCNMMHIDPSYQKELRKQILADVFAKNNIDISDKTEIISGPEFNYRARFQLNDGGLSEKSGNRIIPIKKCKCAEKVINEYLESTPAEHRGKGRIHLFGSEYVEKAGNSENQILIDLNQDVSKTQKNPYKTYGKSKKNLKLKENHYFAGTVASPKNTITVKLNGKKISFDVRGFFQSNLFVFEKVTKLICDSLPQGKNVLDMYSGCGSISVFLADKFENVVLVEHNRDALVFAEQNMAGTKHVSYGLSGAAWTKTCASYCGTFDAAVIDPPRSGMEKEVRDYICKSHIPHIRYLSCDPVTQSRDCIDLIKAGYKLQKIYLLDFYPNTSHIETLAVFEL